MASSKTKARRGAGGKFLPKAPAQDTAKQQYERDLAALAAADLVTQRVLGDEVARLQQENAHLRAQVTAQDTKLRLIHIALGGLEQEPQAWPEPEPEPVVYESKPLPMPAPQLDTETGPPAPHVVLPPAPTAPSALMQDVDGWVENMRQQSANAGTLFPIPDRLGRY